MEAIEHRIVYKSRKDEYRLYPIGDIHAGTLHCAEHEIKKKVKEIQDDPHAIWIGMGDYAECILPNDKRWDVDVCAKWVERSNIAESQRQWLKELLSPIKDKCVGLLEGNHESSIRRYNYQDIHLDLCRDLEVRPLGFTCYVRFVFCRRLETHGANTFIGAFQHGSGAAQTEGGQIMRLKKFMDSFDADIYGLGHIHSIKTNTIPQLRLSENLKIKQRLKVGAVTGSWRTTYTQGIRADYSERGGMYPTVLGCPVFLIIPDKGILRVIE